MHVHMPLENGLATPISALLLETVIVCLIEDLGQARLLGQSGPFVRMIRGLHRKRMLLSLVRAGESFQSL